MDNITCVLPVAGIGKRLQPHTFTIPKVLLPVAGKPMLGYLIEFALSLGMRRFVFIIGHLGDKIEKFVKTSYPDIDAVFVKQQGFLGLGYAIYLTRDHISGPVFINLGDTLIEADIGKSLTQRQSWVGVHAVEDPKRFGVAVIGKNRLVTRMVEKPRDMVSNQALCGVYYLSNSELLFECLQEIIDRKITTKDAKTAKGRIGDES